MCGEYYEDRINDYDPQLCRGCSKEDCPVKLSKWQNYSHRIIAITHTRLFLSTDIKELTESLMYFSQDEKKIKRIMLIIDEKIDMVDIKSITADEFLNLKKLIINGDNQEHIQLFDRIEKYLWELDYPKNSNISIETQNKVFQEGFRFNDDLIQLFLNNKHVFIKEIDNFLTL